jgi:hypothetical protein
VSRQFRIASALVLFAVTASAQYDRPGGPHRTDIAYDGQFTFVRLRWSQTSDTRGAAVSARRGTTTSPAPSNTWP